MTVRAGLFFLFIRQLLCAGTTNVSATGFPHTCHGAASHPATDDQVISPTQAHRAGTSIERRRAFSLDCCMRVQIETRVKAPSPPPHPPTPPPPTATTPTPTPHPPHTRHRHSTPPQPLHPHTPPHPHRRNHLSPTTTTFPAATTTPPTPPLLCASLSAPCLQGVFGDPACACEAPHTEILVGSVSQNACPRNFAGSPSHEVPRRKLPASSSGYVAHTRNKRRSGTSSKQVAHFWGVGLHGTLDIGSFLEREGLGKLLPTTTTRKCHLHKGTIVQKFS